MVNLLIPNLSLLPLQHNKMDETKSNKQDHDTLIRLETKVDILIGEMKEMRDGTSVQLGQHESRIHALEDVVGRLIPIEPGSPYKILVARVDELQRKINQLQTDDKYSTFKQKFIWAAFLFLGGLISWTAQIIATALHIHIFGQ